MAEVWVRSDDGTYDPLTSMKHSTWTINITVPGGGGWRIGALLSDPALPVGGATVQFQVEGIPTSKIRQCRVQLLPFFDTDAANFSDAAQLAAINASMTSGVDCTNAAALTADTVSCSIKTLQPGSYLLAVTVAGFTYILAPNTSEPVGSPARGVLGAAFGLFSVTPSLGSIGGGTLLSLQGAFYGLSTTTAVVLIQVGSLPSV